MEEEDKKPINPPIEEDPVDLPEDAPKDPPKEDPVIESDNVIVEDTEEDPEPKEDTKEKLKHSANENRIIREQNNVLTERLSQVGEIPDPSDDELKKEFPEWEEMTVTERRLAKRTYISDKRTEQMHRVVLESKSDGEWNQKLDTFIEQSELKDEYPEIVENRSEFVKYATKKLHKGVPISILADAFVTRQGKSSKPVKKAQASIMERGGGGKEPQAPSKGMTAEQIANLRKNDYKKYTELLTSGKIAKSLSS